MTWRRNPQEFSNVLEGEKLFEERILGFHELEVYPHVIYNDNPFSDSLKQQLDQWIADHLDELPPYAQGISFYDVSLLVLMSKSYHRVHWFLYTPDDFIIGRGSLDWKKDTFVTCTAFVAFQGFRLYETVLHTLVQELGPLHSSRVLSPGAKLAWERAGARWWPSIDRYRLD